MKKISIKQIVFLLSVVLLALSIASVFLLRTKHSVEYREVVSIKGIEFETRLAITEQERANGLMNVEDLPEDEGMLFVYNEPGYKSFWMKNTLIPLDMIFIDENNRIVDIFCNAEPCTTEVCKKYHSVKLTKYVLEINGGLSENYGFRMGDLVTFTSDNL